MHKTDVCGCIREGRYDRMEARFIKTNHSRIKGFFAGAERGDAGSQLALGALYEHLFTDEQLSVLGITSRKDLPAKNYDQSIAWYSKAAARGDKTAKKNLNAVLKSADAWKYEESNIWTLMFFICFALLFFMNAIISFVNAYAYMYRRYLLSFGVALSAIPSYVLYQKNSKIAPGLAKWFSEMAIANIVFMLPIPWLFMHMSDPLTIATPLDLIRQMLWWIPLLANSIVLGRLTKTACSAGLCQDAYRAGTGFLYIASALYCFTFCLSLQIGSRLQRPDISAFLGTLDVILNYFVLLVFCGVPVYLVHDLYSVSARSK